MQHSALPTATFGGGFTAVAGTPHIFTGNASTDPQNEPLSYVWTFGDGSTSSGATASHTYAIVGPVVASLTVTDMSGLSATATASGSIAPGAPFAIAANSYTGTVGAAMSFDGSASTDPQAEPLTYAWNFGDSKTAVGMRPSHTFALPGSYTVSLTVTNTSNLSATAIAQANIKVGAPVANAGSFYIGTVGTAVNFNGSASSDPQGEPLSYTWTFGDGAAATGMSPGHVYAAPGSYPISLTVINTGNLSSTAYSKATIAAAAPLANAGGPYAGLAQTPVSFDGSGSTDPQGETLSFAWNFGDNTTGTGVSPSHAYAASGNYIVSLTVTDTSNVSATATSSAVIAALPPDRVMAGQLPIANSSVQLYAAGTSGPGSASVPLLAAPVVTGQNGRFSIAGLYECPSPASPVYLVASGGNLGLAPGINNTAITLVAALGSCASFSASSAPVTVDAISTVAAVWPATPDMQSVSQLGSADPRSVSNAFVDSANLAAIVSGVPAYRGIVLANQDLAMRSLANSLESCVESTGDLGAGSPCGRLFADAMPARRASPVDTAGAALAIALNPTLNVLDIFQLGASTPVFQPALLAPPTDWSLNLIPVTTQKFGDGLNGSTVFLGDSITQYWPLPVHNAGMAGQQTWQIFNRFSQDVLGHGFARVVILTGTNDIWSQNGQLDQAVQQMGLMAATARAAGIEPVLCELPPMFNSTAFNANVVTLNAAIANLAMTNGYLLVDYYTPMAAHPEYFGDGVHPNPTGYAVMEAALASVIEQ